jgi:hypothetical protein
MDPLGLALENFNTVGQLREYDPETLTPIDATGVLPDGSEIDGPTALVAALTDRSEMFVQTLTENLMTYALGRMIEHRDMPAIRQIVRDAENDDYRFEAIVRGVVFSDAFMKRENAVTAGDDESQHAAQQETAPQTASLN